MLPTIEEVRLAAGRLDGIAHRTPVITSHTLNDRVGASVYIKAESFQRIGAFKFRGAYNAIASLPDHKREAGIATFSSGNHAQAVALAASLFGVTAAIIMPEDAPPLKVAATRGYGAEVIFYDRYSEDRAALASSLATDRGLTIIPPFDHPNVIAGQGTAALELFDEVGPLDSLVVPIGGGGLISGCSTVAKAQPQPARVIGVEPEAGDDVKQSLAAGRLITIATPNTIADGQQTTSASELTLAVMTERVDEVVLVTDNEIVEAMRFAFERLKIVLEPSGATALAALMAGQVDSPGNRVGLIASGGNIDLARFASLTALL